MKDPVVLWLNGGPGCSSLTGFLVEMGPWRVSEGSVGFMVEWIRWFHGWMDPVISWLNGSGGFMVERIRWFNQLMVEWVRWFYGWIRWFYGWMDPVVLWMNGPGGFMVEWIRWFHGWMDPVILWILRWQLTCPHCQLHGPNCINQNASALFNLN